MKRLYRLPVLALLALSFVAVGCDSGEDEATDAELFVGTFNVTKLEHNVTASSATQVTGVLKSAPNSSQTPFPYTVDDIKVTLTEAKTFTITVNYRAEINGAPAAQGGRPDQTVAGTYTIAEASKTLTLNITGFSTPVQAAYTISETGQATLSVPSVVFNQIFGVTMYQGTVRITMQK